jgi:hypothetical protein
LLWQAIAPSDTVEWCPTVRNELLKEIKVRNWVYSLQRLGLPLVSKFEDPDTGLAFDFLADPIPESPDGSKILAGHEHGLITINLAEANDAATAFGLRIAPNTGRAPKLAMEIEVDSCRQNDFDAGPGVVAPASTAAWLAGTSIP